MASASSRWAWPVQAPGGHGQRRASSRRAWSKLQEVTEKHLHDAQEIPPWHGGVVPARPRRHQARGSRRRHVGESPNSLSTRSRRGQGQAARDQARGRHGQAPELQRWRGCERPGGNRQDLTDRRNHRRLIYRLGTISAADSGGARRNRARRRRGDVVARESTRGKTTRASEGVRPVGLTEPPGRVRSGRLAPTGGPGPTGGPRLAEKGREKDGEVFNQKFKNRNWIKTKVF
jgi:hypothetical protein